MSEQPANVFQRSARWIRHHKTVSIVVVILVAAGLWVWHGRTVKTQKGGFLTAQVTYGDIATTVSNNATVQATQEVVLSFKNSGYVQNVSVTLGQFVKAGQVLAKEQASDYQAQLEQAEANLESAQANYEKAVATQPDQIKQAQASLAQDQSKLALDQTTYNQDQALFAAGAVSRSTLDSARNTYRNDQAAVESAQAALHEAQNTAGITQAAASVKTAQANVTLAQNNMAGSEIVSTMDGYVVNISGNAGEYSQGGAPASSSSSSSSSSNSAQFTITVSSNKLELLGETNEADIAKVKTGDKVTFTVDAFPGKTFSGKIISLAAEATDIQNVEYYATYMSIDDQTGLKAGMPATVTVIAAQKNHVLIVPRTALDFATTFAASQAAASNRSGHNAAGSGGTRTFSRSGNQGTAPASSSSGNQVTAGTGGTSTPHSVVVLQGGKPQVVPVQVGLETNTEAEITSGLTAGQVVVLGSGSLKVPTISGGSNSNDRRGPQPHMFIGG